MQKKPKETCLIGENHDSAPGEKMLFSYGGSFQGRSHISRDIPCQDSSYHGLITDSYLLLIVADGVGSSAHSDEASQIAVSAVVEHMSSIEEPNEDDLRESYDQALSKIEKHSQDCNNPITDYDTTLSVALFFSNGHLLWGHSGDGGIIGIATSGEYIPITKPQKGPDGESVIPLRFKSHWEFGKSDRQFSSIIAVTDGILDILMPNLLRLTDCPIYVPAVRYLADGSFGLNESNIEDYAESRLSFINGPSSECVTDDRTLIVGINSDLIPSMMDESYYQEPDWAALELEWRKRAYPHLYPDSDNDEKDSERVKKPIINKEKNSNKENSKIFDNTITILKRKKKILTVKETIINDFIPWS